MKMCETREPSNSIFYNMSHDFQQLNTLSEVWEVLRSGVRNFIDTHENIVGDFLKRKTSHGNMLLLRHALLSAILKWQKVLTNNYFHYYYEEGKKDCELQYATKATDCNNIQATIISILSG